MPTHGYFHNTTYGGGTIFAPSPQNSGTTGQIYKIQRAFDRCGKFVEGYLILLTSGSPMTLKVRSKSKCLTICSIWFCRALEPYQMEISQYNDMDRVWDTFQHHPISSGEHLQGQGHSRSRGQGKAKQGRIKRSTDPKIPSKAFPK